MAEQTSPSSTAGAQAQKDAARASFEALQDRLIAGFEAMEAAGPAWPGGPAEPGRFERKAWNRTDHSGAPGGGGVMALLKGRVFEKAGIHASTVFGSFAPEFAASIPGAAEDPRFWASGVSLIAHPWNPHAPTVHMNTRFVVTSKAWFGGGADLTPVLSAQRRQDHEDALAFHAAMRAACEAHPAVADHAHFKAWCDSYFHLKHRNEPRGIGGIFFDYLEDGAFSDRLAFVRAVGEAFLGVYPKIVARRAGMAASEAEVAEQLVRRGRYAEFNLLYDRGTLFGLKTGGNVESILSSLPPRVCWP
jgi:coproporphyrinogen III oxidase